MEMLYMEIKILKSKITKILKSHGFVKTEIKQEYGHPKFKHNGFQYDNLINVLGFYVAKCFSNEEQKLICKGKINEMWEILSNSEVQQYISKHGDYAIKLHKEPLNL
jgi:hypothetical protein